MKNNIHEKNSRYLVIMRNFLHIVFQVMQLEAVTHHSLTQVIPYCTASYHIQTSPTCQNTDNSTIITISLLSLMLIVHKGIYHSGWQAMCTIGQYIPPSNPFHHWVHNARQFLCRARQLLRVSHNWIDHLKNAMELTCFLILWIMYGLPCSRSTLVMNPGRAENREKVGQQPLFSYRDVAPPGRPYYYGFPTYGATGHVNIR